MNRNLIVTIIVVLLIVAAGGFYFMSNRTSVPANPEGQTVTPPETTTMEKASLKSFITMSGTQKCDFSDSEIGTSGTVYIGDGKMRGDFSAKVDGKAIPSHIINDGSNVYIWMEDEAKTGFKTSLASVEQMGSAASASSNQPVDINKQVDYKCEGWTIDPVKFAVPTEIKFQDMSQMMEDAAKMMQGSAPAASAMQGNQAACSACNNLTGDAQTQCKRALKCN